MNTEVNKMRDFCETTSSKRIYASEYVNAGVPFYRSKEVIERQSGKRDVSTEIYISESRFEEIERKFGAPQKGDVLLTSVGTLGVPYVVGEGERFYFKDGNLTWFRNFRGLDSRYLYYWFLSPLGKSELNKATIGSSQAAYTINLLSNLDIDPPVIDEQYKVVELLSAYDDLIETNRRRIALLEESARLLYCEWFVKLRFPGHELAKVVNGVPEGWELKPVSDFASLLSRGITPKYDDLAKGLIINQKCIREGRLNLAPARHQSKEVKQDKLVQIGDILINSTGAGTLGRVAQLRCEIADCTVDTHVTIVRPKLAKTMGFLGVALLEMAPVFESMGRGATNQLELGRADIANLGLLTPPEQLQVDFHSIVWTTFEQVQVLIDSCNLLSEARDALLPKLMSGQLAV